MIKRDFLLAEKEKMLSMLEKLPDFYVEMKWDFESSVIPLLGRLAPSGYIFLNFFKKT